MTQKIIYSRNLFTRILEFFKRLLEKPPSRREKPYCKRDFNRFPLDFAVMVDLTDENGRASQDSAELRDISGSGAFFVSAMQKRYHVGQSVGLTVYLMGTDDVAACVRTEATVVRIQPIEDQFFEDTMEDRRIGVAVKFNETFAFERMDKTSAG